MKHLLLILTIITPSLSWAGLTEDIKWIRNNSFCKGYFKSLAQGLPSLPQGQTVIETNNDSKLKLGDHADLNQVQVEQNNMLITSKAARIDLDSDNKIKSLNFQGRSHYQTPDVIVYAQAGKFDIQKDQVRLDRITYRIQLEGNNAWGHAKRVWRDEQHRYYFIDPYLSFCPPNGNTWSVNAGMMIYDPNRSIVILKDPTIMAYDHPVVSAAYLDFATKGRKSGFLKPVLGATPYAGTILSIPYYFNIASNMDLVLGPTVYTKRGGGIDSKLRYLTTAHSGELKFKGLYDFDQKTKRYQVDWSQHSHFLRDFTVDINYTNFSDKDVFKDFGNALNLNDTLHPVERADAAWMPQWGMFQAGVVNFHNSFVESSASIPDVNYVRFTPSNINIGRNVNFSQRFEYAYFNEISPANQGDFGDGVDRAFADLDLSLNLNTSYGFIRPRIGSKFRWYHNDGIRTYQDAIPRFQVVSGLNFEHRAANHLQVLTPQIGYVYVPYKDQTTLPLLDTSLQSTNNLPMFFSPHRFLGSDRVGDENAVLVGASSRIQFDDNHYWDIAGGQQINIHPTRVCLNDCSDELDGTSNYTPLFFAIDAHLSRFETKTNINYDSNIHHLRNLGSELHIKSRYGDQIGLNYQYDTRKSTDQNNELTPLLSRLGLNADYKITPYYRIKPSVFHDFENERSTSYELSNEFKSCCWTGEFKVGRRFVGDVPDGDNYQWYAGFWIYLNGFSHR